MTPTSSTKDNDTPEFNDGINGTTFIGNILYISLLDKNFVS
jgi:hypothetical protein